MFRSKTWSISARPSTALHRVGDRSLSASNSIRSVYKFINDSMRNSICSKNYTVTQTHDVIKIILFFFSIFFLHTFYFFFNLKNCFVSILIIIILYVFLNKLSLRLYKSYILIGILLIQNNTKLINIDQ